MSSLLRLSVQNMLTLVSVNLMLFVDRIILAKHSADSLNASVTAGAITNIFVFGAIAIVGVGDVFIGQCFGAGRTRKIGEVLWQMVWFCLGIAVLFNLMAQFLTPIIFSNDDPLAKTYFSWSMSVGFLQVLVAALTSFFVGTKRFGFALFAAVFSNSLKLVIEIPLVFGIAGVFSGLGVKGCIIATATTQIVHIVILSSVIVRKENRRRFGSLNYRFRPTLFFQCMKLGFPQSLGSMLNYTAWGIVVNLLAAAGPGHLMMYTIIDSTYNLLGFATEGLQKSVLSISANLIGSGKSSDTGKIFDRALWILVAILFLLSIPLFFCTDLLVKNFDMSVLTQSERSLAFLVIWVYFGFDGIMWILNGILTAMGDTLFVNPINGITSFVGVAFTYVATVVTHSEPHSTCMVSIIYGFFSSVLLFLRYRNRRRNIVALPNKASASLNLSKSGPSLPSVFGSATSNGG